jgi:Spy/CpxP family protein refolding chaperone
MNRIILTSALLLSLTGANAFAQATAPQAPPQTQRHVHNPHKAAMKMGEKLGLSQDQTAKLEPILAERQQKMKALRADSTLTDDQKKDQRRQIQQNTHAELSGVLTPEQMQQLRTMQKAHRHDAKAGV